MEDELLNVVVPENEAGANDESVEVEETTHVYRENEGFSVTNTGVMLNLRCRQEAGDWKSDKSVNVKEPVSLAMDVQEVSVVKGSEIDIRVLPVPANAICPNLSWYSSNSSVAYVDDMLSGNGIRECGLVKIYTTGLGTTTITASSASGLTCNLVVNVVEEEEVLEG